MSNIPTIKKQLLKLQKNAYSVYSKFPVASILIDKQNNEYFGVNVENSSYGLTMCAERNAIFSAISSGKKRGEFKEIHLIGGNNESVITPCGACRQVMNEFFDDDVKIIAHSINSETQYTISKLLPYAFDKSKLV